MLPLNLVMQAVRVLIMHVNDLFKLPAFLHIAIIRTLYDAASKVAAL